MGGVAGVIGSVVAAGSNVYQAETQKSSARKQRRQQADSQQRQAAAAATQQRRAMNEQRNVSPVDDVGTLLGEAGSPMGPASTLLTGARGIRRGSTLLSQISRLGG